MYEIIKHFKDFLKDKTSISPPIAKFYVRWVNLCCDYLKIESGTVIKHEKKNRFLSHLAATYEEWQVNQANYALNPYDYFLSVYNKKDSIKSIDSAAERIILADKIHNAMRLKHLSRRTEEIYLKWIRDFYSFINHKQPKKLTPEDMRDFLGVKSPLDN